MHPALSVIFFTTLSGAGYGLLALLGAGLALDLWPRETASLLWPLGLGALLTSTGLLASMAHLGQPLRAWRAFSQWRSSWLSREGVCAVTSYLPMAAIALLALRQDAQLPWPAAARLAGAALLAAALLTVFCTARIYSSLRTIPAWHNAWVAPGYLLFAAYSGGLWLWLLAALHQVGAPLPWDRLGLAPGPLMGLVGAALLVTALKLAYWRRIDGPAAVADIGSATGLGRYGTVSAFEKPHTEYNYINREMGFVLARKHAARLRAFALVCGLGLPLLGVLAAIRLPDYSPSFAALALLSGSLGIFVERWLFFAEARHVVNLYYGARRV
ncbi:dimethyl sulfoxide reductase anchor subunit family protein [Tahibacter harae]|uniref:Dimethyl sulfoxide reductase anchor subunit n=1 Tax=Tahibacter harae TaxID=2963937 RepID=A0ABT1QY69_9GAMM|nr:DmsC/YnfH family molybdoenzyme membrane anchor subunit [Tahibacter harae]MCQ4167218.1 dimethyl sulfoxide reductase anchor subunit [Tahibacter harae]